MKKILFLIHDLGGGGAEKVLVNLVNNMDKSVFDITVMSIFDVGVNKQYLSPEVKYVSCFPKMIPGNSKLMKLLSPAALHKQLIKEHYDIEVSYLEGPCARVISGCEDKNTKKVCWIHIQQETTARATGSFRSEREAVECYNRFDKIVCVSEYVKKDFCSILPIKVPVEVLYNTNESEKIIALSKEPVTDIVFPERTVKLVGVGKLLKSKGFDRLIRITDKLIRDGFNTELYVLGTGPEEAALKQQITELGLSDKIHLLGYQNNPYKYVAKCDLFVCASFAEGFSTAATEALIVGTPVCTVDVSGMKEMLGENNEYGIVTENSEETLYNGIKTLIASDDLITYYKKQAIKRGQAFNTQTTVSNTQKLFEEL